MKTTFRIAALLLALFITLTPFAFAADETDAGIVYIDASGSDSNDGLSAENPVATFDKAFQILGTQGGTVTVVEKASNPDGIKWASDGGDMGGITITGFGDDSVFELESSLHIGGDLRIEHITLLLPSSYRFINARGHRLIMGSGVSVVRKDDEVTTDLCIRGGGDGGYDVPGDTNIVVYSGTYTLICGGSRNGNVFGNTNITVKGGTVATVNGGCNNSSGVTDKNVKGNSYVTITGGTVGACRGEDYEGNVEGERVLDVSRYADAKESWFTAFDTVKPYDPTLAEESKITVKSDGAFINGYSDGTFRPQNTITRAEAMAIISRLIVTDGTEKFTSELSDVESGAWYHDSIALLENLGLLESFVRGGKVFPTQPITREEVCRLIYGIGDFAAYRIADFSDVKRETGRAEIYSLASAGIVNGYSDGTFRPDGTITRAEFVTMIDRFLGRKTVDGADFANKFSDISTHWAKNNIIAASSSETVDGKQVWSVNMYTKTFALSENAKNASEYIKELRTALPTLTPSASLEGIDLVTEKRITKIRAAKSEVSVTGKKYYISADGDDSADGLTEATAWKTLSKANSAEIASGDAVLFRRGDTFRGHILAKSGVTYSAYGDGAKPNIFGWGKNSADASLWKKTDAEGIWEYAESVSEDVGNIVLDGTAARKVYVTTEKNGKHLDARKKRSFDSYKNLTDDLSFVHDKSGKVYLRCEKGNPGEVYGDIEFAEKGHIFTFGGTSENIVIDGLTLAYTGSHGIGAASAHGLTVRNCEFYFIGGSVQFDAGFNGRTWPTAYGNAVQIYGEAADFTVENCYMHDIYDAAMTHQSAKTDKVEDRNIVYRDNVVERCVYGVEIFAGADETTGSVHEGITIENNILRTCGGFGFDYRPDTGLAALIRNGGMTKATKNYVVRNNILDRSPDRLITAGNDGGSLAKYTDNIFVQTKGLPVFAGRNGQNYLADADVKAKLSELGDTGTEVLVVGN